MDGFAHMNTHIHTCVYVMLYIGRDTCEFWYSVNQRRYDVEKSQQQQQHQEMFKFFWFRQLFCMILIVAVLMLLLLLLLLFALLLLLFSLIWTYVVRSLGGIVKIERRRKDCSASQVDGFLLAFVLYGRKSMVNGFSIDDSHWNYTVCMLTYSVYK